MKLQPEFALEKMEAEEAQKGYERFKNWVGIPETWYSALKMPLAGLVTE